MNVPKMRTVPEAIREIQSNDPETCFTLSALRRAIKNGFIPTLTVATKQLVNMNDVYSYLLSGTTCTEKQCVDYGIIRKQY